MVRSCKGIEMLVNLINISYCAMKILPYQNEHFSEYRTKSVQEFRFELSQGIRSQIFFATFVKNIETHIKSNAMTKALKQLIHQQVYVDMKNREIHVGGQLVYYEGGEGYCFHNSETKTDADIRGIPMTQMVYDAFRKQRELNLMLGLHIWDYSDMPFNFLGQICLPFTILWLFLSLLCIFVDDWLRHALFHEEKPHYRWR